MTWIESVSKTIRAVARPAILITTVLLIAVAWLLVVLLKQVNDLKAPKSETIQQVLWLAVAVVVVLIVLLMIAVVLKAAGLNTGRGQSALGLPEGSISAVIALMLLILFAISSVFVFTQISESEQAGTEATGLTNTDVQGLPPDRILDIDRIGEGDAATYTVRLARVTTESNEVGKTTLATISTLLVAIVGFYFGQRSGEKTAEAIAMAAGKGPTYDPTGGSGSDPTGGSSSDPPVRPASTQ